MLWASVVCLNYLNNKSLSWKVYSSKLDNRTFKIYQKISKIWQNKKKKNYAEMVKLL